METIPVATSLVNFQESKTILSLCDHSGNWSQPYHDAGYNVIRVDPKNHHIETERLFVWRGTVQDVWTHRKSLPPIHGILAAPPCDRFIKAGNRYWSKWDNNGETERAVEIVRTILDIVEYFQPSWWALENPAGRIRSLVPELGNPLYSFNPCDYGLPYTKLTYLWGRFVQPFPLFAGSEPPVAPTEKNYIQRIPGCGESRKARRSVTPLAFANAFAGCNP